MNQHLNGFASRSGGSVSLPLTAASICNADEQTAGPDFNFLELANILLCRRKLIITIVACAVGAALVLGLLIAPKYTATARIVVDLQQTIGAGADVSLQTNRLESEIDTHVTSLASRDHLRRVLDSLSGGTKSVSDPYAVSDEKIAPVVTADAALGPGELWRRLKIWVGALAGRAPDRELDELERGLKVLQERSSPIISVSFTARSAERAAAFVNRVVQLYVIGLAEQNRARTNQEVAVLNERAAQLKSGLDKATEAMGDLLSPRPPGVARGDHGKEREARLNALQRDATSMAQAYGEVVERENLIRSQAESAVPEVHILSLASPPKRPSSVNPLLFAFPALIAALIGASLLAVMLERLERPLRSERDVRDALGLPCIGLVPQLPRSYADRPFHYLQNEPFTPYAESIRSALAALDLARPLAHASAHPLARPCRKPTTILISSSVQGEGKTTVATSLGVYAASLGRRVLLIDFDSRRPSLMRILRGAPQTPTSDPQDRPLDEFIQHLPDLHLDYLAMPHGAIDPLAPFLSQNVQHFLRGLGTSYDCVFIDGPPLLGITETKLLTALVDSVIFVVKWGGTGREVVQSAGHLLRNALYVNEDVQVSALVTQVDPRRQASYRYGDVAETYATYSTHYAAHVAPPGATQANSHASGNGHDTSAE
jgi:polysaccharide biosynthesis transport protein